MYPLLALFVLPLASVFHAEIALSDPNEYQVLGVIASNNPQKGVALLKNKTTEKVIAYRTGQNVDDEIRLQRVYQKSVVFTYEGKTYTLGVGDSHANAVFEPGGANNVSLPLAQGVEKEGNVLRVSRSLKESLTGENLNKVLMQAAAVPHMEDGRLIGFRLLEIDDDSIFAAAGFKNGDIVTQINEQSITDAALAIRALNAIRNASTATFGYLRDNTPMQLVVQIK